MGRIILTIPGNWSKQPVLDPGPLTVSFGPYNGGLVEEMSDLAEQNQAFEPAELQALRRHRSVLYLSAEFEAPGAAHHAQACAALLFDLLRRPASAEAGQALGVYVETAMKVLSPSGLLAMPEHEALTLFYLFVEVYGDRQAIRTEGMQAFDLPDVEVPYTGKAQLAWAQAAAFTFAARMVTEGARPAGGHPFRTSESAPLYRVQPGPIPPEALPDDAPADEALFLNPRGFWRLILEDDRAH